MYSGHETSLHQRGMMSCGEVHDIWSYRTQFIWQKRHTPLVHCVWRWKVRTLVGC